VGLAGLFDYIMPQARRPSRRLQNRLSRLWRELNRKEREGRQDFLRACFEIGISPQFYCGTAVQLPRKLEFPNAL